MGFNINEEITTKLHHKDIALIAVAMGMYQEKYKDTAKKDVLERMRRLVDRLGREMADCPQEDEL